MFEKHKSKIVFWLSITIWANTLLAQIPKIDDFTIYIYISHHVDRSISDNTGTTILMVI